MGMFLISWMSSKRQSWWSTWSTSRDSPVQPRAMDSSRTMANTTFDCPTAIQQAVKAPCQLHRRQFMVLLLCLLLLVPFTRLLLIPNDGNQSLVPPSPQVSEQPIPKPTPTPAANTEDDIAKWEERLGAAMNQKFETMTETLKASEYIHGSSESSKPGPTE